MKTYKNGTRRLSRSEWKELGGAYRDLYEIINRQPSSLCDYFTKKDNYIAVEKWDALFRGWDFDPSEYEDEWEETGEDTDEEEDTDDCL